MGKKRPVRKVDNLPSSGAVVTKCGNLNFLELSEPLEPVMGLLCLFFLPINRLQ